MKVLLTGAFRYHPDQIEALQQLGCEVLFLQQETESLPIAAGEIEATVCNGLCCLIV